MNKLTEDAILLVGKCNSCKGTGKQLINMRYTIMTLGLYWLIYKIKYNYSCWSCNDGYRILYINDLCCRLVKRGYSTHRIVFFILEYYFQDKQDVADWITKHSDSIQNANWFADCYNSKEWFRPSLKVMADILRVLLDDDVNEGRLSNSEVNAIINYLNHRDHLEYSKLPDFIQKSIY